MAKSNAAWEKSAAVPVNNRPKTWPVIGMWKNCDFYNSGLYQSVDGDNSCSVAECNCMRDGDETWALPGLLLGAVGVFAFVTGFVSDGPDRVSGLVFGSVAL